LIVPPLAVIDAEPEKFGDVLGPLPASVAEDVVIVNVPAGSGCPLSMRPSVVSVIAALPVTVAEYVVQLPLTPRDGSAGP
jgi:hypothetical protein